MKKQAFSMLLALSLCFSLALPAAAASTLFTDVAPGEYYYESVLWAVDNGVAAGTGTYTFSPNSACSQAQILSFLWRTAGSPAPAVTNPYYSGRVNYSQYYYRAMLWAYEKGVVTDPSLDPDAPCPRSDVALYLWRYTGCPAAADAGFSDVPSGSDYSQAVSWAASNGVVYGTGVNAFSPAAVCTRGQIVTFLHRADAVWTAGQTSDGAVVLTDAQAADMIAAIGTQKGNSAFASMCAAVCLCYVDYWKNGVVTTPQEHGGKVAQWSDVGGVSNSYFSQAQLFSAVKTQLDAGKLCIVHTQSAYSQHWVLAYRYSGGGSSASDFLVADPWDGSLDLLSECGYPLHSDLRVITF